MDMMTYPRVDFRLGCGQTVGGLKGSLLGTVLFQAGEASDAAPLAVSGILVLAPLSTAKRHLDVVK